MKKKILISFFIFLFFSFFFASYGYSEEQLDSGSTTIYVYVIVLSPVDDYTYSDNTIGLFGDKNYLNIFWNAKYNPASHDYMGVRCWLNCPYKSGDIETVCQAYQSCNYIGSQGLGSCSIYKPTYNYTGENFLICEFYNPQNPNIIYQPYPNRTFKTFEFGVQAASGVFTVGKTSTWPIGIISYSFIPSNYTVNISSQSSYVKILNGENTTEKINYGEVDKVYPKLIFETIIKSSLKVLVRPTEDSTFCLSDPDCPTITYGNNPICINGKCWREIDLQIRSGYASMPEYGIAGVIQIILLSSLVFYLIVRRNGSARN